MHSLYYNVIGYNYHEAEKVLPRFTDLKKVDSSPIRFYTEKNQKHIAEIHNGTATILTSEHTSLEKFKEKEQLIWDRLGKIANKHVLINFGLDKPDIIYDYYANKLLTTRYSYVPPQLIGDTIWFDALDKAYVTSAHYINSIFVISELRSMLSVSKINRTTVEGFVYYYEKLGYDSKSRFNFDDTVRIIDPISVVELPDHLSDKFKRELGLRLKAQRVKEEKKNKNQEDIEKAIDTEIEKLLLPNPQDIIDKPGEILFSKLLESIPTVDKETVVSIDVNRDQGNFLIESAWVLPTKQIKLLLIQKLGQEQIRRDHLVELFGHENFEYNVAFR